MDGGLVHTVFETERCTPRLLVFDKDNIRVTDQKQCLWNFDALHVHGLVM